MRVLVYPHVLDIGGSQLNAVELASAVQALGHEVIVFGQPGALIERIESLGLEYVAAPVPGRRPSPSVMAALCGLVRDRGIDVVHGYEWTTAMEAYYGPRARLRVPAVCTVMSMAVAPFLPLDLPLTVGTEQIGAYERARGRQGVSVIEPPVDVEFNSASAVDDTTPFRRLHDLSDTTLTIACVTRLAAQLKLEGLLAAIDVVADLASTTRVQLLIVGDGPDRDTVAERAHKANHVAGRRVVIMTGEMVDPRPAYAVADIVLGMGGSALRAMAFGRPLVVQGEQGYWEPLTPQTSSRFLWTGWYGVGPGRALGPQQLRSALLPLVNDAAMRSELGSYARRLVVERFSLERAGLLQLAVYERAVTGPPTRRLTASGGTALARFAGYKLGQKGRRIRGISAADDFNARPVAATAQAPRHPRRGTDHEQGAFR